MKRLGFIWMLLAMLTLTGCHITKEITVNGNYPPKKSVKMVYKGQTVPKGIYRIGNIKVGGDTALAAEECTYEICLNIIKEEAAKAGADVAVIVTIKEPDEQTAFGSGGLMFSGSSCYTVIADLYVYNKNKLPEK